MTWLYHKHPNWRVVELGWLVEVLGQRGLRVGQLRPWVFLGTFDGHLWIKPWLKDWLDSFPQDTPG